MTSSEQRTWRKPDATEDEADRQRWLDGRAGAPRVIDHHAETGLVMERLPGVHAGAPEFGSAAEATVEAMGRALRALHEVDPSGCPNRLDTPSRIDALRVRFAAEPLDTGSLSPAYRRYSAADLLGFAEEMAAALTDDLVVTHGNIEPAHVLLDGPEVVGLVSFAHLAVADRSRDLALLGLHVAAAFPAELVPLLFETYGQPNPDPVALDLAQLLLELEG